jgi:hypothetical protein
MGAEEKTATGSNGEATEGKKWEATPIEVTHPESVDPAQIRLLREPAWRLRLTIEADRSYLKVKIVRSAPLSNPDRYICFLDGKDEVICTVENLDDLGESDRNLAVEELSQRYLSSVIQEVLSIRAEFGVSYWDVQTNRGRREFVAKDIAENAQWLTESRVMILDVDNNRFEIPDLGALDKRSRGLIDTVL